MKKIIKKLFTIMFAMTLFVSVASIGVSAYTGDENEQTGQATLTIKNLNKDDKVRVWQIIKITYDSSNNTLNYAFTPAAARYFNSKDININDFMAFSDNSDALKTALAGLPADIQTNKGTDDVKWNKPWTNLTSVTGGTADSDGVVTVGSSGEIVIEHCKAGGYFVEPCASTVVYEPMFVPIIPFVDDTLQGNGYSYSDAVLVAKHSSVSIDKYVKRHGSDTWAETANVSYSTVDTDKNFSLVDFRTVAAVPKYVFGTKNVLNIVETLPNGLVADKESVKLYGLSTNNETGTEITNIPNSAITVATDGKTITADFGGDNYNVVKTYNFIKIEYNAVVDANASIASNASDERTANVANTTYTYTCYPYLTTSDANKTLTDSAYIYTGGLHINKYDSIDTSTKLQNATFKLYRVDSNGQDSLTVNGVATTVKPIALESTIKTDSNGVFSLPGLSSDATYYLVETVAPSGYKLDSTPIVVTFDINNLNDDGYHVVDIGNSKANLSLPTTGATGMVAFTVCGLAIMATAVVILIKTRETH